MATKSKITQVPLLMPEVNPAPKMQLIYDFDQGEGVTACVTCLEGIHYEQPGKWKRLDEDGRWSRCDKCGARPLNNAQRADILKVLRNDGQALIGACLGARKTGTGVSIANQYKGVWLVVVPKHTMKQWGDAIAEWAPDATVHYMYANNKTALIDLKEDRGPFSIHLISWQTFARRDFSTYKFLTGVIYDEVHRMAGGTLTQKSAWKINAVRRIGLSGTPAGNALPNLFYVLRCIWWGNKDHRNQNIFRRFDLKVGTPQNPGWLRRHFELLPSRYGGPDSYEIGRELKPGSVVAEIPCYIQHLEDETCCIWHPGGVNASLPAKLPVKDIYVEMTPTQKRLYDKASSKDPVLWLNADTGQLESTMVDSGLIEDLRKQQIALAVPSLKEVEWTNAEGVIEKKMAVTMQPDAESASIDALEDLLEDIVQPADPVLIFTHSKVFAKIVVARLRASKSLDFPVAEWSGDIKQADREKIKDWFGKDGGPQVIVSVIASIAEGTDGLQARCRQEVWLSEVRGNVMLNSQAGGRLPRTGQKRPTQRYNIIVRGTILEDLKLANEKKKTDLDASLRSPQIGLAQELSTW